MKSHSLKRKDFEKGILEQLLRIRSSVLGIWVMFEARGDVLML